MDKPLLMNVQNVTRDFILLDLYRKDTIFYFSPSTVYLNAIAASVLINLYLNNKIELKNGKITIVDENSIRPYNKLLIEYIRDNNIKTINEIAHEVFLDSDFSMQLYELAINELHSEGSIDIETKKHLILNKSIIKLVDQNAVRESYQKLFDTLFNDNQSQEFIALALIIDTFFSVDDYFDESEHATIKEAIERLRKTDLYNDIVVFKDVIEEFYRLTAQRSTNYFGI